MVLFHQGVLLLWQDSHTGCLSLHCAGTCEERMQFGHFTYSLMDDKLCSIQQYLEKCHTYLIWIINMICYNGFWGTLIQNNPQHNIIEKIPLLCLDCFSCDLNENVTLSYLFCCCLRNPNDWKNFNFLIFKSFHVICQGVIYRILIGVLFIEF